ncbi:MAG: helix-turn-helix domain-containing protein [Gemmataceae bacterium]|nr:helix-turn-helix domain-containing protein [Gemmataceae bacterium]
MDDATVIWDDEPGGNVEHVAEHGLTPDEVDEVLLGTSVPIDRSRSSGRPCKFGWTSTGKHIIVVWDDVSDDPPVVYPVTAYEVEPNWGGVMATNPTSRPRPVLTPEQQAKLDVIRAEAKVIQELGTEGPPLDVDLTPSAPFYAELRAFVAQLRAAREAAGLTLAQVAKQTGLAEETLSRLETGAATNPTWQTLGRVAAAVGVRPRLTAEPTAGRA